MEQDWKDQMNNNSNSLKLKCCRQKELKAPGSSDHTLPSWVAQNIMRTPPLKSLQKNTPKAYIICPHLNLQDSCKFSLSSGGWVQNCTTCIWQKGSNEQVIITMQLLGKNYPNPYMAWAILNFEQTWQNSRIYKGLNCKMTKLQFLEGPNAKMHLTMLTSSSSYPKFIYGMPLFQKMTQNRFEFECKFKFELNQK